VGRKLLLMPEPSTSRSRRAPGWRRSVAGTVVLFVVILAFLAGRVRAGADPTQAAASAATPTTSTQTQTETETETEDESESGSASESTDDSASSSAAQSDSATDAPSTHVS